MIKEYKIGPRNSTVLGGPGREFDWTLFCWDGSEVHMLDCGVANHPKEELKAPLPRVDGSGVPGGCQYLHVPFNWAGNATVFRVRPNDSMYAGRVYRGHLVKRQTAVKHEDGVWFWVLEMDDA